MHKRLNGMSSPGMPGGLSVTMCKGNADILRAGVQKLAGVSEGVVWYGNTRPIAVVCVCVRTCY